jgi:DegV family protein with EDD domain
MINIITDSTADLGTKLAAEYDIAVLPLSVSIGGKNYLDGIDLMPQQLFRLVEQFGVLPTTAAPSVGEFCKVFDRPGQSIYVGISSKLSASYANAHLAVSEFPQGKVSVIDSRSVCVGTGILAIKAAELRDKGLAAEEIVAEVETLISKVRIVFVVNTLEYLHKGGRCSAVQAVMGSILKIHPVIEARSDGTLGIKDKIRGSRNKIIQTLLNYLREDLEGVDKQHIVVAHSGLPDEADYLRSEVQKIAAPDDIQVVEAGCVISSHCGPGTICLLYTLH